METGKKQIRIAHIAGGLTTGGVEAVIYNYFSHLDLTDYELVYVAYDPPNEAEKEKFEKLGFTVYSVTKKKENFVKSCMEVYRIFKKHEINVVHSHMTLICFITSVIGMFCGVKVRIAHSHLAQYPTGIKKIIYGVFKWLTRITSTKWLACGEEAAKYLYGEKALRSGKVTILNNAVDIDKFKYQPEVRDHIREKYQIQDKICIGHVGRFTEQKNHTFLIDIFKEIHEKMPNTVLLSVGEGYLEDAIHEKVAACHLEDCVIFTGSCNNTNELYQAMDLFLFPSLYEGLAVVLVETQTAGLEIVASDTITREIALSDSIKYFSLNKSAKEWAEEIIPMLQVGRRNNVEDAIIHKGYSISHEVDKLDRLYRQESIGGGRS